MIDLRSFSNESEKQNIDFNLFNQLKKWDRLYGTAIPYLFDKHANDLLTIEKKLAYKGIHDPCKDAIYSTLPVSIWCRIHIIQNILGSKSIFIDSDRDSIALFLAKSMDVGVYEPIDEEKKWLEKENEHYELKINFHPLKNNYDLAFIHFNLSSSEKNFLTLKCACKYIKENGAILISTYLPYTPFISEKLETCGFEIERVFYDVDHRIIPQGYILEGGCDLILLRIKKNIDWDKIAQNIHFILTKPYHMIELDNIAIDCLDKNTSSKLLSIIEQKSPIPVNKSHIIIEKNRTLIIWYNTNGEGFTAYTTHQKKHIQVVFMPYNTQLEAIVLTTLFDLLGDKHTRIRPQKPTLWKENIL